VTDVVHVHVHRVMAGTFPLRLADLLFTDDALVVPEYAYLTPLFGLARGRVAAAGDTAAERYREGGVAALRDHAERTRRVPYTDLRCVRLYDGGRVGRPKVAVDVEAGPPLAYRVHAPADVDRLANALGALGDRRGFAVDHRAGLGFDPRASLRRFLADR
jgi:hypothetical protein